ncbi:NPCBM/NEW2 domain-containing protein [Salinibacterium soli]|uniref:NPCBM/NEW2 domain-containing protein n=1 Tax=Antiquaquibacter soli TaxID=3064523 RepID=UPI0027298FB6|nr:NPCBM/NEW2 domain-containing protein [Protaetiibacter sp. WY-16]
MPRHPLGVRALVASLACIAVTLSLLTSPTTPAASADSPLQSVDPNGDIPCLEATPAVFKALDCKGNVINRYSLPDSVVPPRFGSNVTPNCQPTRPMPIVSVFGGVEMGVGTSTSKTKGSAEEHTKGFAITFSVDNKPGGVGGGVAVTFNYANTQVTSYSETEERALTSNYSVRETQQMSVPPYHWGFLAFKPQYSVTEVLWTWKEPSLLAVDSTARASGVQYLQIPKEREGNVYQPNSPLVPQGTWIPVSIPMTPAEIDVCASGKIPVAPDQLSSNSLLAPGGVQSLVGLPVVAESAPVQSPVLRDHVGTPKRLIDNPALATGYDPQKGTVTLGAVEAKSMQLTGTSQIAYFVGDNCSRFRARIGYGANMLVAKNGVSRDEFSVSVGRGVDGSIATSQTLLSQVVPAAAPDRPSTRSELQSEIDVALPAGSEFLILTVTATPGSRATSSSALPGVILANPTLECSTTSDTYSSLLTSFYQDPVETVTADMAGTDAEIAADPVRYLKPTSVTNGPTCQNQQGPSGEKLPLPRLNVACSDRPLNIAGTQYDSGVGVHADSTVTWDVPANCYAVKFGVGYDSYFDSYRDPWGRIIRGTQRVAASIAPYGDNHTLGAPTSVGPQITLYGDGSSGVQWFESKALGSGPRQLTISITSDQGINYQALVNIVNPTLTCVHQGSTIATLSPPRPSRIQGLVEVANADWLRSSGFWGPVEKNQSNGEKPEGDGRPVTADPGKPAMAVGGVSGWSSGIGMVPPPWKQGEAQVEVSTLGGACTSFSAWVGIDDEMGRWGSAQFIVYADGKPVATSPVMRGGNAPYFLSADITGAVHVMLAVNNGGDNQDADHADWLEPRLFCEKQVTALTEFAVSAMNWEGPGVSYWGPVERNMSLGEQPAGDGRPISLGAMTGWKTGLGMAPGGGPGQDASVTIPTGGSCEAVTAWVGVDDEVRENWDNWRGSVVFQIWADDTLVATSTRLVSGDQPQFLSGIVTGAQRVRLVATNAGDGNAWDHADWADPTLYCR